MTKIPLFVIIIFICVAVGTVIVNQRLQTARDRPAVQRTDSYTRLSNFAVALRAFLNTHSGKWPERLVDLERDQHLSLGYNLVKGAGLYHYRKPADSVPDDWIIMWSDTNHAPVARGQPWGAAGEVAGKDIPGVAFVLTATLHVEALTLEEFAKRSPSAATTGPASAAGAAVPAASSVTPPPAGGPGATTAAPAAPAAGSVQPATPPAHLASPPAATRVTAPSDPAVPAAP